MRNILKNNRGVTLVEVILSIFLVGVIVASLVAAAAQSSVFSRRIDMTYTASYLAQRRIDMLKRLDFDQVPSAEEENIRIDADGNTDPNGNYLRTTEVEEDYDGNSYLMKVKVSVVKAKVNLDGSISRSQTLGQPVVMETLFSSVE
jgi:type II secretory pathway pseudopilin PulG